MSVDIRKLWNPATMTLSLVIGAVVMTWQVARYFSGMQADMKTQVTEFQNAVTQQVGAIAATVDKRFTEQTFELRGINQTLQRLDASHVEDTDMRLWIERLRREAADHHDVPEWRE